MLEEKSNFNSKTELVNEMIANLDFILKDRKRYIKFISIYDIIIK